MDGVTVELFIYCKGWWVNRKVSTTTSTELLVTCDLPTNRGAKEPSCLQGWRCPTELTRVFWKNTDEKLYFCWPLKTPILTWGKNDWKVRYVGELQIGRAMDQRSMDRKLRSLTIVYSTNAASSPICATFTRRCLWIYTSNVRQTESVFGRMNRVWKLV